VRYNNNKIKKNEKIQQYLPSSTSLIRIENKNILDSNVTSDHISTLITTNSQDNYITPRSGFPSRSGFGSGSGFVPLPPVSPADIDKEVSLPYFSYFTYLIYRCLYVCIGAHVYISIFISVFFFCIFC
jgi:hypothetical protein